MAPHQKDSTGQSTVAVGASPSVCASNQDILVVSCCHDTSNYINYNTFPRVLPKKDCKHAICHHSAFIHKNLWCPLNLGLVGKVMMDDSLLVNLSAPAWTPKSPFVNGFTWPGNAWNFVYPSWEDCLNHRSWRVENGGPSPRGMIASDWLGIVSRQGGGPVKTHLTTKALISNRGEADECFTNWVVDI